MKKFLFTATIISVASIIFTSSFALAAQISFNTRLLLKEHVMTQERNYISIPKIVSYNIDDIEYVKFYIRVNSQYKTAKIEEIGGKEVMKIKNIVLVSIPLAKLSLLEELPCVELIEVAMTPRPELDRAIPLINADKAHSGENLTQAYTGKGVIVGVCDWGFDFTHPMFSDTNGNSRVKRAWKTRISGSEQPVPPNGFDIGHLFTDSSIIKDSLKYISTTNGHGTHVLGIAAGTAIEAKSGTIYSGVATGADIAVVDLSGTGDGSKDDLVAASTILQGIKYLLDYADSVQKPIVINLSLGYPNYRHPGDGHSLEEEAAREILNEHPKGRIIVNSAGNEGGSRHHFSCTLSSGDSAYANTLMTKDEGTYLTFMGNEGTILDITFYYKNQTTGVVQQIDHLLSTAEDSKSMTLSIPNGTETLSYWFTWSANSAFGSTSKPYINFFMMPFSSNSAWQTGQTDSVYYVIKTNTNNLVHCWENNEKLFYKTSSNIKTDANYTISMPGTMEEIITVGAYNSKKQLYTSTGNLYSFSNFSSRGPTTNGAIKPDISAPGAELASAKNNWYTGYDAYITDKTKDELHSFTNICGTSMSCPMVVGVVALMLEINPELTHNEIKQILQATAINDSYTGDVRNNKSNIWGWGKIDAYAILKDMETQSVTDNDDANIEIYPNPTNDVINVRNLPESTIPYAVKIFDVNGKLIYISATTGNREFNLSNFTAGTYFITFDNGINTITRKFVKQ